MAKSVLQRLAKKGIDLERLEEALEVVQFVLDEAIDAQNEQNVRKARHMEREVEELIELYD